MTLIQGSPTSLHIPPDARLLEVVDLSDPSGTIASYEGIYVREYSGKIHLFVISGFDPTMRYRKASEITYDSTGKLTVHPVRFCITRQQSSLIQCGKRAYYEIDNGDGFRAIQFMVSEIHYVGLVIFKDLPETPDTNGGETL